MGAGGWRRPRPPLPPPAGPPAAALGIKGGAWPWLCLVTPHAIARPGAPPPPLPPAQALLPQRCLGPHRRGVTSASGPVSTLSPQVPLP